MSHANSARLSVRSLGCGGILRNGRMCPEGGVASSGLRARRERPCGRGGRPRSLGGHDAHSGLACPSYVHSIARTPCAALCGVASANHCSGRADVRRDCGAVPRTAHRALSRPAGRAASPATPTPIWRRSPCQGLGVPRCGSRTNPFVRSPRGCRRGD